MPSLVQTTRSPNPSMAGLMPATDTSLHRGWRSRSLPTVATRQHHCATSEDALYIIGVWESAEHIRRRWADDEFKKVLASVGFPTEPTERMILDLHQIEPPL